MKKIYSLIIVLVINFSLFAQTSASSKKLFQSVTAGAVLGAFGYTTFSGGKQPFDLSFNFSPSVIVFTPRTYHSTMYGLASNSVSSLNGYFLPKNWDVYALYAKTLHTGGNYLGVGAEKMLIAGDLKCFLLAEFGTDFKGTKILSFGFLISGQRALWKRK